MPGLSQLLFVKSNYSFSSEYKRVIAEAVLQGYGLPTPAQQILEDIKMRGLVSTGLLSRSLVYYNTETNGSIDFACINWCNPGTFTANKSAIAPYFFRKMGLQGDGTQAMFFNTGFNPTVNGGSLYTLADNGINIGIVTNVDDSGDIDFGANDASNADRTSFVARTGANTAYFQNNSTSRSVATGSSSIGRWEARRIAGTIYLLRNGIIIDTFAQAATGLPNVAIGLLGENNNAVFRNFSARRVTHFRIGGSLIGIEAACDLVESNYSASLNNNDPNEIKFLWEGDSISAGTGTRAGLFYPIQTYGLLNRAIKYNNIAVPGWNSAQMLARANTYGQYLNANGVFSLFTGNNDVLQNVPTATTWANIQGIISAVQALGVTRITIGTLMDCSTYSGAQQTLRADLNTLIRNNTSLGYSVMDFSANPNLGTHSPPYFNDEIHPNNLGASVMATIASPVIQAQL